MNYLSIKHARLRKIRRKKTNILSLTVVKKNSSEKFNYFFSFEAAAAAAAKFFFPFAIVLPMGVASTHNRIRRWQDEDDRFHLAYHHYLFCYLQLALLILRVCTVRCCIVSLLQFNSIDTISQKFVYLHR